MMCEAVYLEIIVSIALSPGSANTLRLGRWQSGEILGSCSPLFTKGWE